jgi:hypothetical protein
VRDTVELFSFRRQRKLSLRFLASYLLGLSIQKGSGAAGAAAATAAAAATSGGSSSSNSGGSKSGRGAGSGTSKDSSAAAGAGSTASSSVAIVAAAAAAAAVGAHQQQQAAGSAAVLAAAGGLQGHDSIEDAATALALYNVYCKLQVSHGAEERQVSMQEQAECLSGHCYGGYCTALLRGTAVMSGPQDAALVMSSCLFINWL